MGGSGARDGAGMTRAVSRCGQLVINPRFPSSNTGPICTSALCGGASPPWEDNLKSVLSFPRGPSASASSSGSQPTNDAAIFGGRAIQGAHHRMGSALDGDQIANRRRQAVVGTGYEVVPIRNRARDDHIKLVQSWTDHPDQPSSVVKFASSTSRTP